MIRLVNQLLKEKLFSLKSLCEFEKFSRFKELIEGKPRNFTYLKSDDRPKTLTVDLPRFGGTPETS